MSRKPRADDISSARSTYAPPNTLDFREGLLPNNASAHLFGAPYGGAPANPFGAPYGGAPANPFGAPYGGAPANPFAVNPFQAAPSPFADLHALQAAAGRAAPDVNPLLALQYQQLQQQSFLQQQQQNEAFMQQQRTFMQQQGPTPAGMPMTPSVQAEVAYANMVAGMSKPAPTAPRASARRRPAKTATPDMKSEISRCLTRRGQEGAYT
jgi:hypothetical protein